MGISTAAIVQFFAQLKELDSISYIRFALVLVTIISAFVAIVGVMSHKILIPTLPSQMQEYGVKKESHD